MAGTKRALENRSKHMDYWFHSMHRTVELKTCERILITAWANGSSIVLIELRTDSQGAIIRFYYEYRCIIQRGKAIDLRLGAAG